MRKAMMAATATAALIAASNAVAASPAAQGYGGRGRVQGEIAGDVGGALPFTGLDLALLAVGSLLLLVVGITLRRAARAD